MQNGMEPECWRHTSNFNNMFSQAKVFIFVDTIVTNFPELLLDFDISWSFLHFSIVVLLELPRVKKTFRKVFASENHYFWTTHFQIQVNKRNNLLLSKDTIDFSRKKVFEKNINCHNVCFCGNHLDLLDKVQVSWHGKVLLACCIAGCNCFTHAVAWKTVV